MSQNTTEAFVYLWFDGINRKFYLGVHKGDPNTSKYAHSSSAMPSFTMDTVPLGFKRRILATGTYEDMVLLEADLLMNRRVVINPKYYNKSIMAIDLTIRKQSPYRIVKKIKEEERLKRIEKAKIKNDNRYKQLALGEQRRIQREIMTIDWNGDEDLLTPQKKAELEEMFKRIRWVS